MEVEGDVLTSVKALVRQQTRINKTEERRLGGWGGFGSFSICGTSIALAAEEVVVVGQKEALLSSLRSNCVESTNRRRLYFYKRVYAANNPLFASGQNSS